MAQFNVNSQEFKNNSSTWFESVVLSNQYGEPNDIRSPISVGFGDTSNLTAFQRLRVSDARLLGEYRYMYGEGASFEFNDFTAGTATVTQDFTRNCVLLTTAATNDRAVRQTKQYHPYIPGTSNLSMITFKFNDPTEGLIQSVGLFDDNDGIFLRLNGLNPEIVIRNKGVENVVPQLEWSGDKLDGTGRSGVTIDWSKAQIFACDYQWLGVGRVRVGLELDGQIVRMHSFDHSNNITEVYMNQPSLPIRWEIQQTGSSSGQLMGICGAVYCEGLDTESGFSKSVSTGNDAITLSNTNSQLLLAVRMKNLAGNGKAMRAFARLKNWNIATDVDCAYQVILFHNSAPIVSPTWANIPGYGWTEYTTDKALVVGWQTSALYNVIHDGFAIGGQGSTSNLIQTYVDNRSSAIHQNYNSSDSMVMAIVGTSLAQNAAVRCSMSWIEVK